MLRNSETDSSISYSFRNEHTSSGCCQLPDIGGITQLDTDKAKGLDPSRLQSLNCPITSIRIKQDAFDGQISSTGFLRDEPPNSGE